MAFDEIRFPVDLGFGTSGGPEFLTDIHESAGGQEERTARRSDPKHQWNAAVGVRDMQDLSDLKKFFYARQGPNRGFRFKDPQDFRTGPTPWVDDEGTSHSATDVEIGVGDGSTTQFQLIKKYTSGSITRNRSILKPVSGTTLIEVDGTTQTDGVDFTVDTTTGIVTFTTAPSNTHSITAGFEFDVPCRFLNDDFESNFEAYDQGSAVVPVVEILEDTTVADDFNWGGHLDISLSADRALAVTEARSYSIDAQSSNLNITLQDPTNLPAGGPYFVIHNVGLTNAFNLKDHNDTTLLSVALGTSVTIVLYVEADGTTKGWIAW